MFVLTGYTQFLRTRHTSNACSGSICAHERACDGLKGDGRTDSNEKTMNNSTCSASSKQGRRWYLLSSCPCDSARINVIAAHSSAARLNKNLCKYIETIPLNEFVTVTDARCSRQSQHHGREHMHARAVN
jgi:hypothetical protein